MDLIWEKFTEWLKELLVGGIMDNLTGLFDNVNAKVAEAAGHIGSTPQAWNANIYSMIRSLSDNLILPIAGVILAFVMTLELIQLIADRNNLHDIDTWVFFRWVFKTAAAVLIVSNTWNIVMGVFEAAQSVVNRASGLIVGNTSINLADHIADLEARLLEMNVWTLLGLWLQSFVVGFTMWALTICIFIIIYGRMIEIYLVTSIAPIPMATMMGKEWGGMGQNYLRSLLALAFQGFLIIICIAIYAVLVQNMLIDDNIMKERPLHRYNQETGRKQIIATMACESARRQSVYLKIGCNAYHKRDPTSQPMSFWTEQDVLAYLKMTGIPYASVYGEIVEENGRLTTTGAKRTGCMFCMFGVHLEKKPNRFQRMALTHPKQYDFCIHKLGCGKVLDFLGVPYTPNGGETP